MKVITSFKEAQQAINEIMDWIGQQKSANINLSGRRIINAGASRDENDYVTREELKAVRASIDELKTKLGVR